MARRFPLRGLNLDPVADPHYHRGVGGGVVDTWKWGLLGLSLAVLLLLGLPPRPECGWTEPISGADAIASLEAVNLGGMMQWILIRGVDREDPVLLWLHGGPGAAEMPIARRSTRALEEHFVVVHWDQRGAGKSNPPDFDEATMTFEQYVEDAHELTGILKERFGQEAIYLMGSSWGTQLGIRLADRWPEDYAAYIAVGQVVDHLRAEELGYAWLVERAAATGSDSAVREVEQLGPAPYLDHDRYVQFAKRVESYGGGMDLGIAQLLPIALRAPEYCLADYVRWLRGSNRGSGPMWDEVHPDSLFSAIPRLDVPVYFLSGEKDMNTPVQLVREYFERLEAPRGKELIVFEDTAHTPYLSQDAAFCDVMVRILHAVD